ncbi:MAG: hypothetical protein WBM75_00505 [Polyangiales bacterium]
MFTLALLLGMGCAPYVHSPPGRTLPLESPKALFPRETEFQVEGGGLGGAEIGLPSLKLRVRHGIVKHLDANAEFNFGKIRADHWFRFVGANPYVFAVRVGVKYAFIDHVAITGGVALGGWAGGSFASPDISLLLGYETPHLTPPSVLLGFGFRSANADQAAQVANASSRRDRLARAQPLYVLLHAPCRLRRGAHFKRCRGAIGCWGTRRYRFA